MNPIQIVIAEDEYFTRIGIKNLLEREEDFHVVAMASGGEEAISLVKEHQPQVLLLDIRMPPGIDGLEVIKRLRGENNPVAIIALTNEKRLTKLVEKAGANGFIPKGKHTMFVPALRCVVQTKSNLFINPDVSESYRQLEIRVEMARLSKLERSVWELIGYTHEEIARRLFKAEGRIRNLVTELYFKLDIPKDGRVSQRVQAIDLARLYGILEEPVSTEP